MTYLDHYTIVNAEAGVWSCDKCGAITASPAEHEAKVNRRPTPSQGEPT